MSAIFNKEETGLDGLKVSKEYAYNSSTKTVIVEDKDLDFVVSIFNTTLGLQVYLAGSSAYTGAATANEVTHTLVTTNAANSDEFYIIYKPVKTVEENYQLTNIEDLLKQLNKSIKKILD